ncbi:oxidoreductase NAD-binding domain protein [Necator americanus]|uniref:cytochrome-b5 reductase n=1 Tax=Necator americanus TaxID=51031 RepID=W2TSJ5_NECAM|nr:oxidoreductase NAD-binding domain protein [Necator americanus]ETN84091.1 oxidoreductase NAD-binding domain protein [Necator americanus]
MVTDDGGVVSRPYTPTHVTTTRFEIPIKIYDDGRLTQHVRHWKVGDSIEWRGPYNEDVDLLNKKVPCLLLVAGGTGIAPFVRVIDETLKDDENETRIRLLYCVRSGADILFEEQFSEWARHWNFIIVICGDGKDSLPYLFKCVNTRLTEEHFQEQLKTLSRGDLDNVLVSVCGRTTLEKDVVNFAERAGVDPKKILRFPG